MSKCDNCINSRVIISENGTHSICCLNDKKAVNCMLGKKDSQIKVNDETKATQVC